MPTFAICSHGLGESERPKPVDRLLHYSFDDDWVARFVKRLSQPRAVDCGHLIDGPTVGTASAP